MTPQASTRFAHNFHDMQATDEPLPPPSSQQTPAELRLARVRQKNNTYLSLLSQRHYSKMIAKFKVIFESQLQGFLRQIAQESRTVPNHKRLGPGSQATVSGSRHTFRHPQNPQKGFCRWRARSDVGAGARFGRNPVPWARCLLWKPICWRSLGLEIGPRAPVSERNSEAPASRPAPVHPPIDVLRVPSAADPQILPIRTRAINDLFVPLRPLLVRILTRVDATCIARGDGADSRGPKAPRPCDWSDV